LQLNRNACQHNLYVVSSRRDPKRFHASFFNTHHNHHLGNFELAACPFSSGAATAGRNGREWTDVRDLGRSASAAGSLIHCLREVFSKAY
jgi:hypothetical protein